MLSIDSKACSWCSEVKPFSEFYKVKSSVCANRLHSQCKTCVCQISRHTRNPEKYSMPKRNKRQTKICPICKKNKSFSEYSPRQRKKTLDGISSWCKKCQAKTQKVRRIKYPPKKQKYSPSHNKAHLSNRRSRKNKAGGSFTALQWDELKLFHNFTCLCCKRTESDISLTADHVIPVSKGGTSNIVNIQPLCQSCNSKKYTSIIDYR